MDASSVRRFVKLPENHILNRPENLRRVITAAVLLAAVFLGVISAHFQTLYIIILASAFPLGVGILVLLRNFELAPLLILLTAIFIPFSLPTGTSSRIVISLLATILFAIVWFLALIFKLKAVRFYQSPVNIPLFGFFIATAISIVWSIVLRDPEVYAPARFPIIQIGAGAVIIMLPVSLLMVGNITKDIRHLKIMVAVMLVAGVFGLIRDAGSLNLPVNTGGMFNLWVVTLAIAMAFFNLELSQMTRNLLLLLAISWLFWSFWLNISWLAGWLPALISVGILTLKKSKQLVAILVVFFIVLGFVFQSRFTAAFHSEEKVSGGTRLAAWQTNWSITENHLLFGTGPAGYTIYYMSYFPTNAMATHNNYIDILAQTGIVGFAFCIWFFLTMAIMGYMLCRRLKGRGDFAEAMANASFAGTIACIFIMAFGDWLFPFAYTQTIAGFSYAVYNWIFMGATLAINRLVKA
jgi:O-antigen ligase